MVSRAGGPAIFLFLFLLLFSSLRPAQAQCTSFVCDSGFVDVAIPDNDPLGVDIPMTFEDLAVLLSPEFRLQTWITHSFVGDLVIVVYSPSGTGLVLVNSTGGSLSDLYNGTIWDYQAQYYASGEPITYNGLLMVASPLEYPPFLAEDLNGTWILNVADVAADDEGVVHRFTINLEGTPCTENLCVDATCLWGVEGEACDCGVDAILPYCQLSGMDASDAEILGAFYDSLEATGSLNWDTTTDLCDQTGVTCDLGRVTKLDFSSKSLIGTLPTEFLGLDQLTFINVASNEFYGSIPTEWGALTLLQSVQLTLNLLTGTIPTEWATLSSLTLFYADSNQLTGTLPSEWAPLVNMDSLDLHGNFLTGSLPSEWGSWEYMTRVVLFRNDLSGTIPSEWSSMTYLDTFDIEHNAVSGTLPPEWESLVSMTIVYIGLNQLEGSIPYEWAMLPSLTLFDANENYFSGQLPEEWGATSSLSIIRLVRNQLGGTLPSTLTNLTALTNLDLSENQISGSLPSEWANFFTLYNLAIDSNELTGTLPDEWEVNDFYNLDLSDNHLTGTLPAGWSNMVNLNHLYLGNNQLQGRLPEEWAALTALTELELSSNVLVGTLPSQWQNFSSGLLYFTMASNFFECEDSDYSGWARVTDHAAWVAQCEFFCEEEISTNVTWPRSQELVVTGVCGEGFRGSPKRTCERLNIQRVWGAPTSYCVPISSLEQTQAHGLYFLLPLVPLGVLFLVTPLMMGVPSLKKPVSILSAICSLGILIANCYFIAVIYPDNNLLAALGIFFLVLWFISNLGYVSLLAWLNHNRAFWEPVSLTITSLVAVVDVTIFHVLDHEDKLQNNIDSLRLVNGYLQYLPLLVLQLVSLGFYSPIPTLVAIVFNSLGIGLLVIHEALRWTTRIWRGSKKATLTKTHSISLTDFPSKMVESEKNFEAPKEGSQGTLFALGPLIWLTFPLVVISFLPQALSIVGLPFVFQSLRRYLLSASGKEIVEGPQGGATSFNWFGYRGYFLLSLNLFSFLFVLMLVLPGVTVVGAALLLAHKGRKLLFGTTKKVFSRYRHSLQLALGCLIFTYLPFFTTPPVIRLESFSPTLNLPRWQTVLAVLWYIVFEVGAPIVDIVTDFQFSVQLQAVYQDPFLENREVLFGWIVTSYVSSALGVAIELGKLLYEFVSIRQGFSASKVLEHVLVHSPIGHPLSVDWKLHVIKFLHVIGEDLLQLIVACNTIGFLGRINPLWIFKLVVSLFSVAYKFSKISAIYIYGRKVKKLARWGLQGAYFILYTGVLIVFAFYTIKDDFCDINRTVSTDLALRQLAECADIKGHILITGFEQDEQEDLSANSHDEIHIFDNAYAVALSFENTQTLNSTMQISENSGPVTITFTLLRAMDTAAVFLVEGNANLVAFNIPVLFLAEAGSRASITNNSGLATCAFPALTTAGGRFVIAENSFETLDLRLLSSVSGYLEVSRHPDLATLRLDSLTAVPGEIVISENPGLTQLVFDSLIRVPGMLTLSNNQNLEGCAFPALGSDDFSVEISANPVLTAVDFGPMNYFKGQILIKDNDLLTSLSFDYLYSMEYASKVIIDSNPSLLNVTLSTLACGFVFTVEIRNNPALEAVYMDLGCVTSVVTSNNPNLAFYYP